MNLDLSDDQRRALEAGTPLEVTSGAETYYLLSAEQYAMVREVLDVRDMEPLLADLAPEDWEDASEYES